MSGRLPKPKKTRQQLASSKQSNMPKWLLDQTEDAHLVPEVPDPWLKDGAIVGCELKSVADDESSITANKGKHVAGSLHTLEGRPKKPRLASAGAVGQDGPEPPGPTGVGSPPAASELGDDASGGGRLPPPSDSGEDVVIDDTVFDDGDDCPPPAEGGAAPAGPFGLCRLEAVDADTALVTTEPAFCLPVWGAYQLRVLRGAVSLHGATLTADRARFEPVFALRVKSLPALRPAAAESAPPEVSVDQLRAEFPTLPGEAADALRAAPGCALLLRRLPSRLLQLLAERHGEIFAPRGGRPPADRLLELTGCRLPRHAAEMGQLALAPLLSSPQWDDQLRQLTARAAGPERLRVAFAGGKGVGKSTWLYVVLNSLLNSRRHVYVLDFDPGQAEFTPCACVSLLRVDRRVLGPSFTHISPPIRSIFLGEVSMANDPSGYLEAVSELTSTYKELAGADDAPLLVNTMGWAKGLGEDLLLEVLGEVQPTDVLEIVSPHKQSFNFAAPLTPERVNGAGRSWLLQRYRAAGAPPRPAVSYRHVRLESLSPAGGGAASRQGSLAPWMYRQLNTTAFVASLELPDRKLCQLVPVCVSWSSLAVHVATENVLPQHVMHAINGTVVALCRTDPATWLRPDDRRLFSLLPPGHRRPDCLGFGLVRGVDPDGRVVYLLTDVADTRLEAVNTLVRGPHHVLDLFGGESGLRSWSPALTGHRGPLDQPNQRRKVARPGGGRGRPP